VQGLARRVDHGTPQLVQEQPGRFVSNVHLSLEQQCRYAALVGRHQKGRPKPHRQRELRSMKHRAGSQ
jgi:hypothetical protein